MATTELEPAAVIEDPNQSATEIPTANILPAARDFPPDAWHTIRDVPVFAEHRTTTRKGRELVFDRRRLQLLAANCNRRIRDTGDYAGIVVGHTPDPSAAYTGPPMPLIGLAGPFRLGLIRQPGAPAKWAILADFHVRQDMVEAIRRYPRRSAELWVEDAYEDMYLDPIALLGAEAPRLDMGLLYSAVRRDGAYVEKYSACAPSATSVFIPSDDRQDYSAGPASASANDPNSSPANKRTDMAFSPEEIQQIVEAIGQSDWAQWAQAQMKAAAPPEVDPTAAPVQLGNQVPGPAAAPPELAPVAAAPADEQLPVKYARLTSEMDTLRQTVDTLNTQLGEERAKRTNTERYAALSEQRRTRLFDLDEEFERVKYGKMGDDAFTAHIALIGSNYRPIPLDTSLPTFDTPGGVTPDRPGGGAATERYSKEVSDKAMGICKRMARNGEKPSYEEVLEQVVAGDP